jgi:hypothetical protein
MGRPDPLNRPRRGRVRRIDWKAALVFVDRSPAGTPFLIGRLHRAVATQINRGDYADIDPTIYEAWSANRIGQVSEIWIRKKP